MRISANVLLFGIMGITLFLVILAVCLFYHIGAPSDEVAAQDALDHWRFFLEVSEAIGAGFLLVALGFLIPHLLRETQHKIERIESSRISYTEATTAAHHLPLKVAALDYKDALALIESVHQKKYRAETYGELHGHLSLNKVKHKDWRYSIDSTFEALIDLLEDNISNWDTIDCQKRLSLIRKVIPRKKRNPDNRI